MNESCNSGLMRRSEDNVINIDQEIYDEIIVFENKKRRISL